MKTLSYTSCDWGYWRLPAPGKPRHQKKKYCTGQILTRDDGNWSLDDYDSITVSLQGGNYQIENHRHNYLWEELTNPVFDTLNDHIALETLYHDKGFRGGLWRRRSALECRRFERGRRLVF